MVSCKIFFTSAMAQMDPSASPLKPYVSRRSRSSWLQIFEVKCLTAITRASSALMPSPLSRTSTRSRPKFSSRGKSSRCRDEDLSSRRFTFLSVSIVPALRQCLKHQRPGSSPSVLSQHSQQKWWPGSWTGVSRCLAAAASWLLVPGNTKSLVWIWCLWWFLEFIG